MQTVFKHPQGIADLCCYPLEHGEAKGSVVICPGGGYRHLSPREDQPVAEVFLQAGFHAFVLHYEVDHAPLAYRPVGQLGWAVATLRQNAQAFGIDPQKIAVCGFSAGGHLAASLGVMWHRENCFAAGTPLDEQKPNALILSYPVISGGQYAHAGSFENLAGQDKADWEQFSLEKMVDEKTPPTFLWHTASDQMVPVQNSLLFANALLAHQIPLELHVYPFGEHGLSIATAAVQELSSGRLPDPHVATWTSLATEWLTQMFA